LTRPNTPVTIAVKANDSDPDGTLTNPTIVMQPTSGTVVVNGDGTVTYTPTNPTFVGSDVFTYSVCDNGTPTPKCDIATVIISVLTPDVFANPDYPTATLGTTTNINVLANDADNGLAATLTNVSAPSITTPPTKGVATVKLDGTIDYTPNNGVSGTDVLIYRICDKNNPSVCDTALVTITLSPAAVGVKLAVKVFLQGAYDSVAFKMRDDLRSRGFIPSNQPYNSTLSSRFSNHTGTETVANSVLAVTGNNAIVDWVYVDLRDANDNTFVLATCAALVQRDGDVVDLDGVSPLSFSSAIPASYYISVNHRNHLGALTANAIALTATPTTVDFTTNALAVNGVLPMKTYSTTGKRALWGGNANSDKKLIFQGPFNDADRVKDDILFAQGNPNGDFSYIEPGYRQGDINMDGDVKYQGPSNDLDPIIFFNIVLYPLNTTYSPIYIMYERIP
jgi:hypothetical protein